MTVIKPTRVSYISNQQSDPSRLYSRPALSPWYEGMLGAGQSRYYSNQQLRYTLQQMAVSPFSVNSKAYIERIRAAKGIEDNGMYTALGTMGGVIGAGVGALTNLGVVRLKKQPFSATLNPKRLAAHEILFKPNPNRVSYNQAVDNFNKIKETYTDVRAAEYIQAKKTMDTAFDTVRATDATVDAATLGSKIASRVGGTLLTGAGLVLDAASLGVSFAGLTQSIKAGDAFNTGLNLIAVIADSASVVGDVLELTPFALAGQAISLVGAIVSAGVAALQGWLLGRTVGRSFSEEGSYAQKLFAENLYRSMIDRPITAAASIITMYGVPALIGLGGRHLKGPVGGITRFLSENALGNQVRAGISMMALQGVSSMTAAFEDKIMPKDASEVNFVSAISIYGDINDNLYGATRNKAILLGLAKKDPHAMTEAFAQSWGMSDGMYRSVMADDIRQALGWETGVPIVNSLISTIGELLIDPQNLNEVYAKYAEEQAIPSAGKLAAQVLEFEYTKQMMYGENAPVSAIGSLVNPKTGVIAPNNVGHPNFRNIVNNLSKAYAKKGKDGLRKELTNSVKIKTGADSSYITGTNKQQLDILVKLFDDIYTGKFEHMLGSESERASIKRSIAAYQRVQKKDSTVAADEIQFAKNVSDTLVQMKKMYTKEDEMELLDAFVHDMGIKLDSKNVHAMYTSYDNFRHHMDNVEVLSNAITTVTNPATRLISYSRSAVSQTSAFFNHLTVSKAKSAQKIVTVKGLNDNKDKIIKQSEVQKLREKTKETKKLLEEKLNKYRAPNKGHDDVLVAKVKEYAKDDIAYAVAQSEQFKAVEDEAKEAIDKVNEARTNITKHGIYVQRTTNSKSVYIDDKELPILQAKQRAFEMAEDGVTPLSKEMLATKIYNAKGTDAVKEYEDNKNAIDKYLYMTQYFEGINGIYVDMQAAIHLLSTLTLELHERTAQLLDLIGFFKIYISGYTGTNDPNVKVGTYDAENVAATLTKIEEDAANPDNAIDKIMYTYGIVPTVTYKDDTGKEVTVKGLKAIPASIKAGVPFRFTITTSLEFAVTHIIYSRLGINDAEQLLLGPITLPRVFVSGEWPKLSKEQQLETLVEFISKLELDDSVKEELLTNNFNNPVIAQLLKKLNEVSYKNGEALIEQTYAQEDLNPTQYRSIVAEQLLRENGRNAEFFRMALDQIKEAHLKIVAIEDAEKNATDPANKAYLGQMLGNIQNYLVTLNNSLNNNTAFAYMRTQVLPKNPSKERHLGLFLDISAAEDHFLQGVTKKQLEATSTSNAPYTEEDILEAFSKTPEVIELVKNAREAAWEMIERRTTDNVNEKDDDKLVNETISPDPLSTTKEASQTDTTENRRMADIKGGVSDALNKTVEVHDKIDPLAFQPITVKTHADDTDKLTIEAQHILGDAGAAKGSRAIKSTIVQKVMLEKLDHSKKDTPAINMGAKTLGFVIKPTTFLEDKKNKKIVKTNYYKVAKENGRTTEQHDNYLRIKFLELIELSASDKNLSIDKSNLLQAKVIPGESEDMQLARSMLLSYREGIEIRLNYKLDDAQSKIISNNYKKAVYKALLEKARELALANDKTTALVTVDALNVFMLDIINGTGDVYDKIRADIFTRAAKIADTTAAYTTYVGIQKYLGALSNRILSYEQKDISAVTDTVVAVHRSVPKRAIMGSPMLVPLLNDIMKIDQQSDDASYETEFGKQLSLYQQVIVEDYANLRRLRSDTISDLSLDEDGKIMVTLKNKAEPIPLLQLLFTHSYTRITLLQAVERVIKAKSVKGDASASYLLTKLQQGFTEQYETLMNKYGPLLSKNVLDIDKQLFTRQGGTEAEWAILHNEKLQHGYSRIRLNNVLETNLAPTSAGQLRSMRHKDMDVYYSDKVKEIYADAIIEFNGTDKSKRIHGVALKDIPSFETLFMLRVLNSTLKKEQKMTLIKNVFFSNYRVGVGKASKKAIDNLKKLSARVQANLKQHTKEVTDLEAEAARTTQLVPTEQALLHADKITRARKAVIAATSKLDSIQKRIDAYTTIRTNITNADIRNNYEKLYTLVTSNPKLACDIFNNKIDTGEHQYTPARVYTQDGKPTDEYTMVDRDIAGQQLFSTAKGVPQYNQFIANKILNNRPYSMDAIINKLKGTLLGSYKLTDLSTSGAIFVVPDGTDISILKKVAGEFGNLLGFKDNKSAKIFFLTKQQRDDIQDMKLTKDYETIEAYGIKQIDGKVPGSVLNVMAHAGREGKTKAFVADLAMFSADKITAKEMTEYAALYNKYVIVSKTYMNNTALTATETFDKFKKEAKLIQAYAVFTNALDPTGTGRFGDFDLELVSKIFFDSRFITAKDGVVFDLNNLEQAITNRELLQSLKSIKIDGVSLLNLIRKALTTLQKTYSSASDVVFKYEDVLTNDFIRTLYSIYDLMNSRFIDLENKFKQVKNIKTIYNKKVAGGTNYHLEQDEFVARVNQSKKHRSVFYNKQKNGTDKTDQSILNPYSANTKQRLAGEARIAKLKKDATTIDRSIGLTNLEIAVVDARQQQKLFKDRREAIKKARAEAQYISLDWERYSDLKALISDPSDIHHIPYPLGTFPMPDDKALDKVLRQVYALLKSNRNALITETIVDGKKVQTLDPLFEEMLKYTYKKAMSSEDNFVNSFKNALLRESIRNISNVLSGSATDRIAAKLMEYKSTQGKDPTAAETQAIIAKEIKNVTVNKFKKQDAFRKVEVLSNADKQTIEINLEDVVIDPLLSLVEMLGASGNIDTNVIAEGATKYTNTLEQYLFTNKFAKPVPEKKPEYKNPQELLNAQPTEYRNFYEFLVREYFKSPKVILADKALEEKYGIGTKPGTPPTVIYKPTPTEEVPLDSIDYKPFALAYKDAYKRAKEPGTKVIKNATEIFNMFSTPVLDDDEGFFKYLRGVLAPDDKNIPQPRIHAYLKLLGFTTPTQQALFKSAKTVRGLIYLSGIKDVNTMAALVHIINVHKEQYLRKTFNSKHTYSWNQVYARYYRDRMLKPLKDIKEISVAGELTPTSERGTIRARMGRELRAIFGSLAYVADTNEKLRYLVTDKLVPGTTMNAEPKNIEVRHSNTFNAGHSHQERVYRSIFNPDERRTATAGVSKYAIEAEFGDGVQDFIAEMHAEDLTNVSTAHKNTGYQALRTLFTDIIAMIKHNYKPKEFVKMNDIGSAFLALKENRDIVAFYAKEFDIYTKRVINDAPKDGEFKKKFNAIIDYFLQRSYLVTLDEQTLKGILGYILHARYNEISKTTQEMRTKILDFVKLQTESKRVTYMDRLRSVAYNLSPNRSKEDLCAFLHDGKTEAQLSEEERKEFNAGLLLKNFIDTLPKIEPAETWDTYDYAYFASSAFTADESSLKITKTKLTEEIAKIRAEVKKLTNAQVKYIKKYGRPKKSKQLSFDFGFKEARDGAQRLEATTNKLKELNNVLDGLNNRLNEINNEQVSKRQELLLKIAANTPAVHMQYKALIDAKKASLKKSIADDLATIKYGPSANTVPVLFDHFMKLKEIDAFYASSKYAMYKALKHILNTMAPGATLDKYILDTTGLTTVADATNWINNVDALITSYNEIKAVKVLKIDAQHYNVKKAFKALSDSFEKVAVNQSKLNTINSSDLYSRHLVTEFGLLDITKNTIRNLLQDSESDPAILDNLLKAEHTSALTTEVEQATYDTNIKQVTQRAEIIANLKAMLGIQSMDNADALKYAQDQLQSNKDIKDYPESNYSIKAFQGGRSATGSYDTVKMLAQAYLETDDASIRALIVENMRKAYNVMYSKLYNTNAKSNMTAYTNELNKHITKLLTDLETSYPNAAKIDRNNLLLLSAHIITDTAKSKYNIPTARIDSSLKSLSDVLTNVSTTPAHDLLDVLVLDNKTLEETEDVATVNAEMDKIDADIQALREEERELKAYLYANPQRLEVLNKQLVEKEKEATAVSFNLKTATAVVAKDKTVTNSNLGLFKKLYFKDNLDVTDDVAIDHLITTVAPRYKGGQVELEKIIAQYGDRTVHNSVIDGLITYLNYRQQRANANLEVPAKFVVMDMETITDEFKNKTPYEMTLIIDNGGEISIVSNYVNNHIFFKTRADSIELENFYLQQRMMYNKRLEPATSAEEIDTRNKLADEQTDALIKKLIAKSNHVEFIHFYITQLNNLTGTPIVAHNGSRFDFGNYDTFLQTFTRNLLSNLYYHRIRTQDPNVIAARYKEMTKNDPKESGVPVELIKEFEAAQMKTIEKLSRNMPVTTVELNQLKELNRAILAAKLANAYNKAEQEIGFAINRTVEDEMKDPNSMLNKSKMLVIKYLLSADAKERQQLMIDLIEYYREGYDIRYKDGGTDAIEEYITLLLQEAEQNFKDLCAGIESIDYTTIYGSKSGAADVESRSRKVRVLNRVMAEIPDSKKDYVYNAGITLASYEQDLTALAEAKKALTKDTEDPIEVTVQKMLDIRAKNIEAKAQAQASYDELKQKLAETTVSIDETCDVILKFASLIQKGLQNPVYHAEMEISKQELRQTTLRKATEYANKGLLKNQLQEQETAMRNAVQNLQEVTNIVRMLHEKYPEKSVEDILSDPQFGGSTELVTLLRTRTNIAATKDNYRKENEKLQDMIRILKSDFTQLSLKDTDVVRSVINDFVTKNKELIKAKLARIESIWNSDTIKALLGTTDYTPFKLLQEFNAEEIKKYFELLIKHRIAGENNSSYMALIALLAPNGALMDALSMLDSNLIYNHLKELNVIDIFVNGTQQKINRNNAMIDTLDTVKQVDTVDQLASGMLLEAFNKAFSALTGTTETTVTVQDNNIFNTLNGTGKSLVLLTEQQKKEKARERVSDEELAELRKFDPNTRGYKDMYKDQTLYGIGLDPERVYRKNIMKDDGSVEIRLHTIDPETNLMQVLSFNSGSGTIKAYLTYSYTTQAMKLQRNATKKQTLRVKKSLDAPKDEYATDEEYDAAPALSLKEQTENLFDPKNKFGFIPNMNPGDILHNEQGLDSCKHSIDVLLAFYHKHEHLFDEYYKRKSKDRPATDLESFDKHFAPLTDDAPEDIGLPLSKLKSVDITHDILEKQFRRYLSVYQDIQEGTSYKDMALVYRGMYNMLVSKYNLTNTRTLANLIPAEYSTSFILTLDEDSIVNNYYKLDVGDAAEGSAGSVLSMKNFYSINMPFRQNINTTRTLLSYRRIYTMHNSMGLINDLFTIEDELTEKGTIGNRTSYGTEFGHLVDELSNKDGRRDYIKEHFIQEYNGKYIDPFIPNIGTEQMIQHYQDDVIHRIGINAKVGFSNHPYAFEDTIMVDAEFLERVGVTNANKIWVGFNGYKGTIVSVEGLYKASGVHIMASADSVKSRGAGGGPIEQALSYIRRYLVNPKDAAIQEKLPLLQKYDTQIRETFGHLLTTQGKLIVDEGTDYETVFNKIAPRLWETLITTKIQNELPLPVYKASKGGDEYVNMKDRTIWSGDIYVMVDSDHIAKRMATEARVDDYGDYSFSPKDMKGSYVDGFLYSSSIDNIIRSKGDVDVDAVFPPDYSRAELYTGVMSTGFDYLIKRFGYKNGTLVSSAELLDTVIRETQSNEIVRYVRKYIMYKDAQATSAADIAFKDYYLEKLDVQLRQAALDTLTGPTGTITRTHYRRHKGIRAQTVANVTLKPGELCLSGEQFNALTKMDADWLRFEFVSWNDRKAIELAIADMSAVRAVKYLNRKGILAKYYTINGDKVTLNNEQLKRAYGYVLLVRNPIQDYNAAPVMKVVGFHDHYAVEANAYLYKMIGGDNDGDTVGLALINAKHIEGTIDENGAHKKGAFADLDATKLSYYDKGYLEKVEEDGLLFNNNPTLKSLDMRYVNMGKKAIMGGKGFRSSFSWLELYRVTDKEVTTNILNDISAEEIKKVTMTDEEIRWYYNVYIRILSGGFDTMRPDITVNETYSKTAMEAIKNSPEIMQQLKRYYIFDKRVEANELDTTKYLSDKHVALYQDYLNKKDSAYLEQRLKEDTVTAFLASTLKDDIAIKEKLMFNRMHNAIMRNTVVRIQVSKRGINSFGSNRKKEYSGSAINTLSALNVDLDGATLEALGLNADAVSIDNFAEAIFTKDAYAKLDKPNSKKAFTTLSKEDCIKMLLNDKLLKDKTLLLKYFSEDDIKKLIDYIYTAYYNRFMIELELKDLRTLFRPTSTKNFVDALTKFKNKYPRFNNIIIDGVLDRIAKEGDANDGFTAVEKEFLKEMYFGENVAEATDFFASNTEEAVDSFARGYTDQYIITRKTMRRISDQATDVIGVAKHFGIDIDAVKYYKRYVDSIREKRVARSKRKVTRGTDLPLSLAMAMQKDRFDSAGIKIKSTKLPDLESDLKQYDHKVPKVTDDFTDTKVAENAASIIIEDNARVELLGDARITDMYFIPVRDAMLKMYKIFETSETIEKAFNTLEKTKMPNSNMSIPEFLLFSGVPAYRIKAFILNSNTIFEYMRNKHMNNTGNKMDRKNIKYLNNYKVFFEVLNYINVKAFREKLEGYRESIPKTVDFLLAADTMDSEYMLIDTEGYYQKVRGLDSGPAEERVHNNMLQEYLSYTDTPGQNRDDIRNIITNTSAREKALIVDIMHNLDLAAMTRKETLDKIIDNIKYDFETSALLRNVLLKTVQEPVKQDTEATKTLTEVAVKEVYKNHFDPRLMRDFINSITEQSNAHKKYLIQIKDLQIKLAQLDADMRSFDIMNSTLNKRLAFFENLKNKETLIKELEDLEAETTAKINELKNQIAEFAFANKFSSVALLNHTVDRKTLLNLRVDGTSITNNRLTNEDVEAFYNERVMNLQAYQEQFLTKLEFWKYDDDLDFKNTQGYDWKGLLKWYREVHRTKRLTILMQPFDNETLLKRSNDFMLKLDTEWDKLSAKERAKFNNRKEHYLRSRLSTPEDLDKYFDALNAKTETTPIVFKGKEYHGKETSLNLSAQLTPTLKEIAIYKWQDLRDVFEFIKANPEASIGFVSLDDFMTAGATTYNNYKLDGKFSDLIAKMQHIQKLFMRYSLGFLFRNYVDTWNQLMSQMFIEQDFYGMFKNRKKIVRYMGMTHDIYTTYRALSEERLTTLADINLRYVNIEKILNKSTISSDEAATVKIDTNVIFTQLSQYIKSFDNIPASEMNPYLQYRFKKATNALKDLTYYKQEIDSVVSNNVNKQQLILLKNRKELTYAVRFLLDMRFSEYFVIHSNMQTKANRNAHIVNHYKEKYLKQNNASYNEFKLILFEINAFMQTNAQIDQYKSDEYETLHELVRVQKIKDETDTTELTYEELSRRIKDEEAKFKTTLGLLTGKRWYDYTNEYIENTGRIAGFLFDRFVHRYTFNETVNRSLKRFFNYGQRDPIEMRLLSDIPYLSFPIRSIDNWIDRILDPSYIRLMSDVIDGVYGQYADEDGQFDEFEKFQIMNGWIPITKKFGLRFGHGMYDIQNILSNTSTVISQRSNPLLRGIATLIQTKDATEALKQLATIGVLTKVANTVMPRKLMQDTAIVKDFVTPKARSIGTTLDFTYDFGTSDYTRGYAKYTPYRYRYPNNGRYAYYENIYKDWFNKYGRMRVPQVDPMSLVKNIQWKAYVRWRRSKNAFK